MKQLSLFMNDIDDVSDIPQKKISFWKLFIDGASRNNPGLSGAGVYILKNDQVVLKKGYFLGIKTNNQAEYLALLIGLYYFKELGVDSLDSISIYSDSQLMISQLGDVYKVKNSVLKQYYDIAKKLLRNYNYSLHHILRHKNTKADELANEGIDKKIKLSSAFIQMMQTHDIEF